MTNAWIRTALVLLMCGLIFLVGCDIDVNGEEPEYDDDEVEIDYDDDEYEDDDEFEIEEDDDEVEIEY